MKTNLLFLFLALLSIITSINAQADPSAGPITTLKFDHTTFDFGTIDEGEVVSHTYVFTNTGDEALIIIDAKGSCGCTVPKWPREPIAAGETGEIIIEFNSKHKTGQRNQTVRITTNTRPQEHVLFLAGFVNKEGSEDVSEVAPTKAVEVETEAAVPARGWGTSAIPVGPVTSIQFEKASYNFGEIEAGERVTQVYTFTNTGDETLVLSDAKGSCGCTVPQWPRHPIAPGETASLTVEFNSTGKRGRRNQKVTITANTNPPQTFLYLVGDVLPSPDEADPSFDFVEDEEKEIGELDPSCFAIYPNPTAEILSLDMKDNMGQSAVISIFSQTGALMAKKEINRLEATVTFYVDHYPSGTYIANVQVGERKPESQCFVKVE